MRQLWREYTRLYWHGYPGDFETYLGLTHLESLYANDALDDLIEQSNEQGAPRPDDLR